MISAIKSVAILKASLDQNRDLIDNYIPFIASLANQQSYKGVDVHTIQRDFLEEYGLHIPYHPMVSILSRCTRRGIVRTRNKTYFFDREKVAKHSLATDSFHAAKRIENLIDGFRQFSKQTFSKDYSADQATSAVIAFLKTYDADIILSSRDISMFPKVTVDRKDSFIFHKFVLYVHANSPETYLVLVELAVGYLYASSVLFTQLKNTANAVKKLRIVLDTRLLLRLVGLEGPERQDVYRKLLETLVTRGAKLRVFEHTVEEIDGILEDCIRWVENPKYNPKFAGPALKHFVEYRYKVSDVVLIRASIDSLLERFGVRKMDGSFSLGLEKHQIDEPKLYETIVEEYKRNSDKFEEWSKREILYRDVKSISAISRMRKGRVPKILRGAQAIFITTNSGLARAVSHFSNSERGSHHLCECITDVLLGTQVWLDSPSVVQDLQYKRILADTLAAIQPDEDLVEKYRIELNKLKDRNEISEHEYYYLRSHPRPIDRLEEKTLGDPDAFYDRLPEEILAELRSEMESKIRESSDSEIAKRTERISVLESQLDKAKRESGEFHKAIKRSRKKINRIATGITVFLSVACSGVLVALLFLSILPARSLVLRLVIGIPVAIASTLNLIFGVTVKSYSRALRDWIKERMVKLMGIE